MKLAPDRPYSDPEKAARKLLEIANSVEIVQDGRIYIELINMNSSVAEVGYGVSFHQVRPPLLGKIQARV
jgi:hypothetical protein